MRKIWRIVMADPDASLWDELKPMEEIWLAKARANGIVVARPDPETMDEVQAS